MLDVDPVARTAEVQGMTTYEDLVDATLAHGLMPLVVPQLKTITLGGAVTGLGIESTSFRTACRTSRCVEMEVLTGDGEIVTARPDSEHADLFARFPNSYGTLGYALRLRSSCSRSSRTCAAAPAASRRATMLADAIAEISEAGEYDGERVDFVDGTVFGPDELYLTLGAFADDGAGHASSDYTGQQIYYRSIQRARPVDYLTVRDYLWRWDTDWFWCSRRLRRAAPGGAPAVAAPAAPLRRLPPARRARPALPADRPACDRRARPPAARSRSSRTSRSRSTGCPEFLDFFHREIGIAPGVAVPAAAARRSALAALPDGPRASCTSTSASGRRSRRPGRAGRLHNRHRDAVAELDGHKSLYSDRSLRRG